MAHMYAKAPPAFAKDPWAWDYTRDRIEQNTGVPYDQWQGRHFAGAAAMYKNVVRKYGTSMAEGKVTLPHECVNCGSIHEHYVDDYVCTMCREQVEAAPNHQTASSVVQSEGSVDAIKEKLYESLGHAAKDRKAGKAVVAPVSPYTGSLPPEEQIPEVEPVWHVVREPQDASEGISLGNGGHDEAQRVSRNYRAMRPDKLRVVTNELEGYIYEGEVSDAARRAIDKGENVEAHYEAALRAAQEKGV